MEVGHDISPQFVETVSRPNSINKFNEYLFLFRLKNKKNKFSKSPTENALGENKNWFDYWCAIVWKNSIEKNQNSKSFALHIKQTKILWFEIWLNFNKNTFTFDRERGENGIKGKVTNSINLFCKQITSSNKFSCFVLHSIGSGVNRIVLLVFVVIRFRFGSCGRITVQ